MQRIIKTKGRNERAIYGQTSFFYEEEEES